jgi:predicted phage-related endonuclease
MDAAQARKAAEDLIWIADQADRSKWLVGRQGGLGGSDMSAICNENPFKNAIEVYDSIVRPEWAETRRDNTDRLWMGQYLEPRILGDLYIKGGEFWPRPGGPVTVWRPPLVCRKGREWQRGSADGLEIPTVDELYIPDCNAFLQFTPPGIHDWWARVVEVKTHGYHGSMVYSREPDADEPVPPSMVIQASWYGDLWSIKHASLAALMDTHVRRNWTWTINQDFVADLLTIGEDFWAKHILKGIEPSPDGSEGWNRHLRRKYKTSIGGSVVKASPALDEIVRDLKSAWLASKDADRRLEALSQTVKDAMGEHERTETHLGPISWATRAGKLSWRKAIDVLYQALGWNAVERERHEAAHLGEASRTFTVPHARWKK